ncbi:unnamed protein product [Amoebophrya sp. A120]|nr:unnamed protein product [Amoebophrya sp. A120]|eukprot:GSA120T00006458001.1
MLYLHTRSATFAQRKHVVGLVFFLAVVSLCRRGTLPVTSGLKFESRFDSRSGGSSGSSSRSPIFTGAVGGSDVGARATGFRFGSAVFGHGASTSSSPGRKIRRTPRRPIRSYEFRFYFALRMQLMYDGGDQVCGVAAGRDRDDQKTRYADAGSQVLASRTDNSNVKKNRIECAVCLQQIDGRACLMRCGHAFCLECSEHLESLGGEQVHARKCPLCRKGDSTELPSTRFLTNCMEAIYSAGEMTAAGGAGAASVVAGGTTPRDLFGACAQRSDARAGSTLASCSCRRELCPRQVCVNDLNDLRNVDAFVSLFIEGAAEDAAVLDSETRRRAWETAVIPYMEKEIQQSLRKETTILQRTKAAQMKNSESAEQEKKVKSKLRQCYGAARGCKEHAARQKNDYCDVAHTYLENAVALCCGSWECLCHCAPPELEVAQLRVQANNQRLEERRVRRRERISRATLMRIDDIQPAHDPGVDPNIGSSNSDNIEQEQAEGENAFQQKHAHEAEGQRTSPAVNARLDREVFVRTRAVQDLVRAFGSYHACRFAALALAEEARKHDKKARKQENRHGDDECCCCCCCSCCINPGTAAKWWDMSTSGSRSTTLRQELKKPLLRRERHIAVAPRQQQMVGGGGAPAAGSSPLPSSLHVQEVDHDSVVLDDEAARPGQGRAAPFLRKPLTADSDEDSGQEADAAALKPNWRSDSLLLLADGEEPMWSAELDEELWKARWWCNCSRLAFALLFLACDVTYLSANTVWCLAGHCLCDTEASCEGLFCCWLCPCVRTLMLEGTAETGPPPCCPSWEGPGEDVTEAWCCPPTFHWALNCCCDHATRIPRVIAEECCATKDAILSLCPRSLVRRCRRGSSTDGKTGSHVGPTSSSMQRCASILLRLLRDPALFPNEEELARTDKSKSSFPRAPSMALRREITKQCPLLRMAVANPKCLTLLRDLQLAILLADQEEHQTASAGDGATENTVRDGEEHDVPLVATSEDGSYRYPQGHFFCWDTGQDRDSDSRSSSRAASASSDLQDVAEDSGREE